MIRNASLKTWMFTRRNSWKGPPFSAELHQNRSLSSWLKPLRDGCGVRQEARMPTPNLELLNSLVIINST